jgi:hypothetical protein
MNQSHLPRVRQEVKNNNFETSEKKLLIIYEEHVTDYK